MSGDVRFIRVRGRIVPIRAKNKSDTKEQAVAKGVSATIGGAYVGGAYGAVSQTSKFQRINKVLSHLQNKEITVNASEFLARTGVKAKLVTNAEEAFHAFKKASPQARQGAVHTAMNLENFGGGAAALHRKTGPIVFTRKITSPSVLAHELGHIKDFAKRGAPNPWDRNFLGRITGAELRMEKRAWKLAPSASIHAGTKAGIYTGRIKKVALLSYKVAQRATRVGAAIGALAGISYGIYAYNNAEKGKK